MFYFTHDHEAFRCLRGGIRTDKCTPWNYWAGSSPGLRGGGSLEFPRVRRRCSRAGPEALQLSGKGPPGPPGPRGKSSSPGHRGRNREAPALKSSRFTVGLRWGGAHIKPRPPHSGRPVRPRPHAARRLGEPVCSHVTLQGAPPSTRPPPAPPLTVPRPPVLAGILGHLRLPNAAPPGGPALCALRPPRPRPPHAPPTDPLGHRSPRPLARLALRAPPPAASPSARPAPWGSYRLRPRASPRLA